MLIRPAHHKGVEQSYTSRFCQVPALQMAAHLPGSGKVGVCNYCKALLSLFMSLPARYAQQITCLCTEQ